MVKINVLVRINDFALNIESFMDFPFSISPAILLHSNNITPIKAFSTLAHTEEYRVKRRSIPYSALKAELSL